MTLPPDSPAKSIVTPPSALQTAARWLLGSALMFAGYSHLTSKRQDFQAQVPKSLPLDKDFVVLASGVAELSLGASLIVLSGQRRTVGKVAAAFFVAVFPGNISQYLTRTPAFGLNTDRSRLVRMAFQPLLVLWALWSTGALNKVRDEQN
ncbi:hypothetical protein EHF33_08985 [Deinococcus psychrotolerans]|uniref:DoxX family membrane protein n=1 Tax=Deinococcus psychrotolerans TaxID=2489213 RepID=A0A3G8YFB2_9DEIO|nr:hypothetical protein [Deinococcus psychrotolerans]AZI42867.1 hypothetical protein EHF33_08985 [Deinococcus psychrotolerans]